MKEQDSQERGGVQGRPVGDGQEWNRKRNERFRVWWRVGGRQPFKSAKLVTKDWADRFVAMEQRKHPEVEYWIEEEISG